MDVYHYNAITKAYTYTSPADLSPLEQGVFLIPANATTVAPPATAPDGMHAVWTGSVWELQTIPTPPAPTPPAITEKTYTPAEHRAAAYRTAADPVFFKWQRGEATQADWLAAIAAVKAKYPD